MGHMEKFSDSDHRYLRPARRHRIQAHIARLGALLLVVLGLVVVTGGAASAHTSSITSTCDNLTVG